MRGISKQKQLYRGKPVKSLVEGLTKTGGRNNKGRISVRRKGGGHKRLYRKIDFKRYDLEGTVKSIEYDPNRSGYIASVSNEGKMSYILAPVGLSLDDKILSGENADIKIGHALKLENIPTGTFIHNVELLAGKGSQLIRSAGCRGQLLQKNEKNSIIRLPSGERYVVSSKAFASIGAVSNPEHNTRVLGKAGRSRWLGKRPSVRGVAMNPIDHPHGGGEGKTSGGRPSVTPWGKPTKGQPTRKKNKKKRKF
jgi:large subunit ribosomal protein L2